MSKIHLKFLVDTDLANYKKISMFLGIGTTCTWKCGKTNCQNMKLAKDPIIEVNPINLVERYLSNPLSHAFVLGGLEPLDNIGDVFILIDAIRQKTNDDIVIYTGYEEKEVQYLLAKFATYQNIIIKYGRYMPEQSKHFDEILGIELASNNQYAKRIGEY